MQERGVLLGPDAVSRLSTYYERLTQANARMNLTRIEGEENTAHMHFCDSLSPLWLHPLPQGARCLDVGAGAGFPSVPLAIARPDLSLVLLDSVGKKVAFLQETAEIVPNIRAIHARAEDLARREGFREGFDAALARAVAPLPALCELTLPFVKVDGVLLAWKGPAAPEELEQAVKAIAALGGGEPQVLPYSLMDGQYARVLIAVPKIRHTPPHFPRKPELVKKKPIGC